MNNPPELDAFLRTDPQDVGCDKAMEVLHIYVELVVSDARAAERLPGVAAHLAACGPWATTSKDYSPLYEEQQADPTGLLQVSRQRYLQLIHATKWSFRYLARTLCTPVRGNHHLGTATAQPRKFVGAKQGRLLGPSNATNRALAFIE